MEVTEYNGLTPSHAVLGTLKIGSDLPFSASLTSRQHLAHSTNDEFELREVKVLSKVTQL